MDKNNSALQKLDGILLIKTFYVQVSVNLVQNKNFPDIVKQLSMKLKA